MKVYPILLKFFGPGGNAIPDLASIQMALGKELSLRSSEFCTASALPTIRVFVCETTVEVPPAEGWHSARKGRIGVA
jgi:hypothetical protein